MILITILVLLLIYTQLTYSEKPVFKCSADFHNRHNINYLQGYYQKSRTNRGVMFRKAAYPPGATLTINLDGLGKNAANVRKYFDQEVAPYVNLKFSYASSGPNLIVVDTIDGSTCWGARGAIHFGKESGYASNPGVCAHEFLHVLNVQHELQNPNRSFKFIEKNVLQYYKGTFSNAETYKYVLSTFNKNDVYATEFDSKSVMLYSVPKELTDAGVGFSTGQKLSVLDKKLLADIYGTPRNFYRAADDMLFKYNASDTVPIYFENKTCLDRIQTIISSQFQPFIKNITFSYTVGKPDNSTKYIHVKKLIDDVDLELTQKNPGITFIYDDSSSVPKSQEKLYQGTILYKIFNAIQKPASVLCGQSINLTEYDKNIIKTIFAINNKEYMFSGPHYKDGDTVTVFVTTHDKTDVEIKPTQETNQFMSLLKDVINSKLLPNIPSKLTFTYKTQAPNTPKYIYFRLYPEPYFDLSIGQYYGIQSEITLGLNVSNDILSNQILKSCIQCLGTVKSINSIFSYDNMIVYGALIDQLYDADKKWLSTIFGA